MLTAKKQAAGSTTELKILIYRSNDENGRCLNLGTANLTKIRLRPSVTPEPLQLRTSTLHASVSN